MLSDQQLIEKLQHGSATAFKIIVNTCADELTNYCARKLNNFNDAKNLVDALLSRWFAEKFAGASVPLEKWMLQQVDEACCMN